MRVEHRGVYCAVDLQDGPVQDPRVVLQVDGEERALWWERAVAAFPDYADYARRTERVIPLFVLEPATP